MQLFKKLLLVTFLHSVTCAILNLTEISTNGVAKADKNSCENAQEAIMQHHWIMEQRFTNLANTIDAGQTSFSERIDNFDALGENMLAHQRALKDQLKNLEDRISRQLQDNRFGVVNPPTCPSFENIARLQAPALRTYCEMSTLGGGWIVIQQRLDGSVDFNRNWADYRAGFGTAGRTSEFWLGLEAIHWITNSAEYELAIELKGENSKYAYVRYTQFRLGPETEKYWIRMGQQSGTTYDGLNFVNSMSFSTKDQANDDGRNCARDRAGGWWYAKGRNSVCTISNLNGPYRKLSNGYGIEWSGFSNAGTYSRMMIRRK